MLAGPTGVGKSTIVNVAAGSKIIFEPDYETCEWKAIATPELFPIGHRESCTFEPKFWKNQKTNIVYADCPGLNDSRGILHEILKSFFLKELAKTARSLKILLVCDLPCLKAERMGVFGIFLEQIQFLFPKLSLINETRLIVTKCSSMFNAKGIVNKMRGKLDYKE